MEQDSEQKIMVFEVQYMAMITEAVKNWSGGAMSKGEKRKELEKGLEKMLKERRKRLKQYRNAQKKALAAAAAAAAAPPGPPPRSRWPPPPLPPWLRSLARTAALSRCSSRRRRGLPLFRGPSAWERSPTRGGRPLPRATTPPMPSLEIQFDIASLTLLNILNILSKY